MNTIQQVKENLASIHHVDDSNIDKLNLLCEEINHINKGVQPDTSLIRPLLDILEANPNYDFGMPGYVVHTLETYYKKGLEQELIGSIKRNPTLYTIWDAKPNYQWYNKQKRTNLLLEYPKGSTSKEYSRLFKDANSTPH